MIGGMSNPPPRGDADPSMVLYGKSFTNAKGYGLKVGTMPNYTGVNRQQAARTWSAQTGKMIVLPKGGNYNEVDSEIHINSAAIDASNIKKGVNFGGIIGSFDPQLAPQGNATAEEVLKGKTFQSSINTQVNTGTMEDHRNKKILISDSRFDGISTTTQIRVNITGNNVIDHNTEIELNEPDLLSENILEGKKILGRVGSAKKSEPFKRQLGQTGCITELIPNGLRIYISVPIPEGFSRPFSLALSLDNSNGINFIKLGYNNNVKLGVSATILDFDNYSDSVTGNQVLISAGSDKYIECVVTQASIEANTVSVRMELRDTFKGPINFLVTGTPLFKYMIASGIGKGGQPPQGNAIPANVMAGITFQSGASPSLQTGVMQSFASKDDIWGTFKDSWFPMGNTWQAIGIKGLSKGFYDENSVVYAQVPGLLPENIAYGVNIGTEDDIPGKFTGDGTAARSDIRSGVVAYSRGIKLVGTANTNYFVSGTVTDPTASNFNVDVTFTPEVIMASGSGKYNGSSVLYSVQTINFRGGDTVIRWHLRRESDNATIITIDAMCFRGTANRFIMQIPQELNRTETVSRIEKLSYKAFTSGI